MFGIMLGGHHPAHLRKIVGEHVLSELVQATGKHGILVQGGPWLRFLEILKIGERIILEISILGVVRQRLLVYPPSDAGGLQTLGVGGPRKIVPAIVERRSLFRLFGKNISRPMIEAIRIGASEQ